MNKRAELWWTGAGRFIEPLSFLRLFCSLPARIKFLFVLPRSVFLWSLAVSDFYFLHALCHYTTFGNYDIWTSCELERVVEAVSEFIFALKKLNEHV